MTFDKQALVSAMGTAYSLFSRLPYWDNTAKLHGKMALLEPTAQLWDGKGDLGPLLGEIKFLEDAIRRLHDRDPHTRLLRHLTEWRAKVEHAVAESSSAVEQPPSSAGQSAR
jgi:hypothetical protein